MLCYENNTSECENIMFLLVLSIRLSRLKKTIITTINKQI